MDYVAANIKDQTILNNVNAIDWETWIKAPGLPPKAIRDKYLNFKTAD